MQENDEKSGSEGRKTPEHRTSYGSSDNPTANSAKYQKGENVHLILGKRGSFWVEIVEVRKHNGFYQYQVKQNGDLYKGGGWIDQDKLRES